MAIYHMQAKVVSRGSGRSAVAASAYMSCSRMYNDYDGIQHDYTRKQGLIYQEVILPPMAPLEWNDREQLWNAVEENEKTKDSRLAREFVVALPVELDKDSNISLLQNFIQKNFVDMGMCADFAIHNTDGHNPHAHILLTGRPLLPDGSWAQKVEKVYICTRNDEQKLILSSDYAEARNDGWERQYAYQVGDEKQYMTAAEAALYGYPMKSREPRNTNKLHPLVAQWRSVEQLIEWRKAWADVVNRYLQAADSSIRIDHRSYKERGIDLIPMIHEGSAARRIEARGGVSRRCEKNRQIRAENARKQQATPLPVFQATTVTSSHTY